MPGRGGTSGVASSCAYFQFLPLWKLRDEVGRTGGVERKNGLASAFAATSRQAQYDSELSDRLLEPIAPGCPEGARLDRRGELSDREAGDRHGGAAAGNSPGCRPHGHRIRSSPFPRTECGHVATEQRGSLFRLEGQALSPCPQFQQLPALRGGRQTAHLRAEVS